MIVGGLFELATRRRFQISGGSTRGWRRPERASSKPFSFPAKSSGAKIQPGPIAESLKIRRKCQNVCQAAQRADRERSHLAALIGAVKTQDRQFRKLVWALRIAFAIGLVASPFLAGLLPFGLNGRIAALVMMQGRWAQLAAMQAGNPTGWAQLAADADLVSANHTNITDCRKHAAKAKTAERCTIRVTPPGV